MYLLKKGNSIVLYMDDGTYLQNMPKTSWIKYYTRFKSGKIPLQENDYNKAIGYKVPPRLSQ